MTKSLSCAGGATLFHLVGPRDPVAPDSWLPAAGHLAGYTLTDYVPDIADADVYVCGPAAWAGNVLSAARSAGVREDQLRYERFDW